MSWLTHYDVQGRGHGVVGAHGGEADAVGGTLNKNRQIGKTVKNAQRRDVTQTRRQKEVEEIKLWVTGIASTAKKKPSRIFAREPDLPGWCRCEGSRGTELPPDSLGPRRRPPASSRPGRGWSRWTCHPLRHTPPWAGEPKKKNHQSPGGRRRARWRKLAQKSIFKGTKFKVCFLLFWCCMCHHEGFYWTAKFCPAKGSVLVIWRPLWSSSVADKNRNLQQELFCNLKVSRLSEKRNKIIKSSSFFNSRETEKWIIHLRVSCQLNWFPAVLLLWKAIRWFDALTRQAPSAPPLSSGDLWRGWRTRWLQRTTGTLLCVHTFFFKSN